MERSRCVAASPREQQRLKKAGGYLVQDGICLALEEVVKATNTGRVVLSPETRYERTLVDFVQKKSLQSLAECGRECSLWEERHVCDGHICMKFVR